MSWVRTFLQAWVYFVGATLIIALAIMAFLFLPPYLVGVILLGLVLWFRSGRNRTVASPDQTVHPWPEELPPDSSTPPR